jgi:K+/H+ antiporter YhaU regulatory subunit KhtT
VPDGCRTVVAAVRDARHHLAASLAAGPGGRVLNIDEITARLIAQTTRQRGLSLIYQDLLDFAGDEFYPVREPALVGTEFGQALLAYATSSVVGLVHADGTVRLNPPPRTVIRADDLLVVVTHDDDTAVPHGQPLPVAESAIAKARVRAPAPERLLLLGWNRRAPMIVRQLDAFLDAGSTLDIVADDDTAVPRTPPTDRLGVTFHRGDTTEPHTLGGLDVPSYDRVIVLGSDQPATRCAHAAPDPDDRTLVTLLHLRALEDACGAELSVVTELSDDRNRLLAPLRNGSDVIVSGRLISLLMTQIRHLADLFDGLLTASGAEIHLKPATDYVRSPEPVPYATLVESARRRGQCALGYRLQAEAAVGPSFGVHLNPDKREPVLLGERDWAIVLAAE